MGNIGIDVSKEELAKQCAEGRRYLYEARQRIQLLERALQAIMFTYSGDDVASLAHEVLEGGGEMLNAMEARIPRNKVDPS